MPTNLLVIVSYGSGGQIDVDDTQNLAKALSQHLQIPVQPAFLDTAPSVGEAIQLGVAEHHPDHVIVLPLFLGANAAKHSNVQLIVEAAQDRWSDVAIIYGEPLGTHPGVIAAYTDLLPPASDTTLFVVGRTSRDPAETEQMAQALNFASVKTVFADSTLTAAIEKHVRRQVVVMPYLLYEKSVYASIQAQIRHLNVELTPHLPVHPGIIEAISQRYHEALTELTGQAQRRVSTHSHGAGGSHAHVRIKLPPRYQNGAEVSAAPMGAADLIFDANGQVAWDQIWGDFCDLALAGGPPHRGTLLEPVAPELIAAQPEQYRRVLAELERGIRLVTQLPVITSTGPGWIGIQCASEEMALWLLRAIIVENVSVRRENDVIYLPAGPHFRLEHEIKNVITVIAKTHHYWTEHITG